MKYSLATIFLLFGLIQKAQIPGYIPTNGLMAWYPFTGNANDMSPGVHHGIVTGASLTTDRFNNASAAYLYNGTNNYITVADNVNFRPQNFTISSWVTFSSTPTGYHLIIAKNVGAGSPESIDMNYAQSYGGWFCNIGTVGGNGPFLTPAYSVSVGPWYNFVYQFDDVNNVQKIYTNGVFTASSVVNMSVGYDAQPWTFGMEYESGMANFFFKGKIDDIGIWDRILTPTEITDLYCAASISAQPAPLSQTLSPGSSTTFICNSSNPNSTYQWQHDIGGGFLNIANGGQYSGATTSTLNVANVTLSNNNEIFRCIVTTASCSTLTSNAATLTVQAIIGVEKQFLENIFTVYPNPASEKIHIKSKNAHSNNYQYKMCNLIGEVILIGKLESENTTISIDNLAPGIYFLELGDRKEKVVRIVKL